MNGFRSMDGIALGFASALALTLATDAGAYAEERHGGATTVAATASSAAHRAVADRDADATETNAGAVRYTCPMHPEVLNDAPGRCPHCGMKLVEQEQAPQAAGWM